MNDVPVKDGLLDADRAKLVNVLASLPKIEKVVLFGSRAMGTYSPASDIDLALYGDELTFQDVTRLASEIEECNLPVEVDLIRFDTITSEPLKAHIEKYGKVFYENQSAQQPGLARKAGHVVSNIDGGIYPRGFSADCEWPWPLIPAKDLVKLNYGKALRDGDRTPGKIPVYGTNGRCGWNNKCLANGPGVVLGRKGQGPLGVEWCNSDYWVIDTAYFVTTKDEILDLRFFYYAVKYIGLNHLKDGTSNPSLSRSTFDHLLIPVPPKAVQIEIAQTLKRLDDKIELNRKMNETLEAMARALFKSWFVDFDPVRAKAEGRDTGLPEHIAALFPDSFEDSELGELPTGWTVKSLGAVTTYLNRGISPSYIDDGGVLVLNQKCIRDGEVDTSKGRRHDPSKRSIIGRTLQFGDILVNSTGVGTLGRVAQFLRVKEEAIVDSHITVVRADSTELTEYYLGIVLGLRQGEIEALGEGSTGQTELSRTRLAEIPILVPSPSIIDQFEHLCSPLRQARITNWQESAILASLRDALLPKLISGELRVLSTAKRGYPR